jgi:RNA polymerase sigma-70 factor, ECF subfamily
VAGGWGVQEIVRVARANRAARAGNPTDSRTRIVLNALMGDHPTHGAHSITEKAHYTALRVREWQEICEGATRANVIKVMPDAEQSSGTTVPQVTLGSGRADDDAQRFTALYREHHARVRDFARRRVGGDLAQEIVAETFLIAWRRIDAVPVVAVPWLYRVALYEIANARRRQAKAERIHDALLEHHPAPETGEEEDAFDLARRVSLAFVALEPGDQEILRLAAWEHLSSADGAAVLGCSVPAYRMRLHRARIRLAALSGAEKHRTSHRRAIPDTVPAFSRVHNTRARPGPELAT